MLNSPITGNPDVDSFLYDLQNAQSTPTGLVANTVTGVISDSNTGTVVGYLYRYIHVRYADDNIGTNISTSDTGKLYFGVQNTDSLTASAAPADYTWYLTTGFGASDNLYYTTSGGRQIRWAIDTTAPTGYILAPATPIDLDVVTGAEGISGISATVAYKIQSQSASTPTFAATTTGNSVPAGWTATLGTPAVGQVVWTIFGRYNSEAVTVDGIPANTTSWGGLTAASVFQDIRSDNWNGSNPPSFASPGTWGSAGYYIRRDDGTVIANNLGARGTLQSGTAVRSGITMTGQGAALNADGTFALGNSTANVVSDGSSVFIRGFVNDLVSVAPFAGTGSVTSFHTETYTSGSSAIKNGKYTCNIAGSLSIGVKPAAYRRIYVYVIFRVNVSGSGDVETQQTGYMVPVADSASTYTHVHGISLNRSFNLAAYAGSLASVRAELGVVCYGLTDTTQYAEIQSVTASDVRLDVREYNI